MSGVNPSLHHIVIVGGGAAGLELATKLGDILGRRRKAEITLVERTRTHIWKPHLHEVAVGRDAVDYLAHASDHHFRYRIGEMVGLDRRRREVQVAASYDAEGEEITPPRSVPYGDAAAVLLLAQTFDPRALASLGVIGVRGDAHRPEELCTISGRDPVRP